MRRPCFESVYQWLLTGLAAVLGCQPARNPELIVPPTPVVVSLPLRLEGTVVDVNTEQVVAAANVQLIGGPRAKGKADTLSRNATATGAFVFDSLASGRYILRTRRLGYQARYDTLVLATAPPVRLTVPMQPALVRLGYWPPDSQVVAAARAQRRQWICDRDPESFQAAEQGWVSWLLIPSLRANLGLPAVTSEDLAQIERIRNRRICQRAADAYDKTEGATGLATTVFRFKRFYLVSQPTWSTQIVFDEHWQLVLRTIQE